ncbi:MULTISPECIES: AGE family epimerase/isomerase [unclassified Psychrobacter]|uniref:AGE family epimerase/isomerase n=1 Tax=unclassified Psychrobacter TaxID=196806 RepID=UPI0018F6EADA|nr:MULTISPECIES: AGE family epimerase/isomerase [unclassified Psychrobacter]
MANAMKVQRIDSSVCSHVQHSSWAAHPSHQQWLINEGQRLLTHYQKARMADGFGSLGNDGKLQDQRAKGVVTARMIHCYALASMMGVPSAGVMADYGIDALLDGALRDKVHGGWFEDSYTPSRKNAYLHAFVLIAAGSATLAQRPRAAELLSVVLDIIETHFWQMEESVMQPSFATDWSDAESYQGANCNMHTTEAFLIAADATNDDKYLQRALQLGKRFGHDIASAYDWRIPEHFDASWQMLPDYNQDQATDDLRPWGLTPGHFAEWAGLLIKIETALQQRQQDAPAWLLDNAIALFDSAMARGWAADGKSGMVYTIGWDDAVSVAIRPYWVQAETANTALLLARRTGDRRFEAIYREVWDYIALYLVDYDLGGWRHEVDASGNLSAVVYPHREDLYHDFQATVTPLIPNSGSIAGGLLRKYS